MNAKRSHLDWLTMSKISYLQGDHHVGQNLPLTSKKKFRFGLVRPGQTRPKRNFCFEVKGRFWPTWWVRVTLYLPFLLLAYIIGLSWTCSDLPIVLQKTTSRSTTLPRMLRSIPRLTGTTSTGTRRRLSASQVRREKRMMPDPGEICHGQGTDTLSEKKLKLKKFRKLS